MRIFLFSVFLFLGFVATAQKTETLTNTSVINLHKAGLEDQIIISKINSSSTKFDLSTEGLIALKKGGLSKEVIQAMMDKASSKSATTSETSVSKSPAKTAASVKQVPVPEFVNQIMFYNRETNKISSLEKTKADQKTKAKGLGLGGYSMNLEIAGETSSVKLTATEAPAFVVSFAEGMGEPSAWFALYKSEIKKGKRTAVWIQGNGVGKTTAGEGLVTFSVKSVGERLFEIAPSQKMEKGEYFFVNKGSASNYGGQGYDVYAFSLE